METIVNYLIVIVVILVGLGVFLAYEFSYLKDDVRRIYMNSASDFALRHATTKILTAMNEHSDELLTEIACLATKNNADIQRVREGYKPGDIIEYDGKVGLVLKLGIESNGLDRFKDVYHIYVSKDGNVYEEDRDDVDKNSKFLRHVDLILEEPVL